MTIENSESKRGLIHAKPDIIFLAQDLLNIIGSLKIIIICSTQGGKYVKRNR